MRPAICITLVVVLAAFASAKSVPPSPDESALMARYIVNEAEWVSIATTSIRDNTKNYPFVNLKSVSDGAKGKGNGVPYIFLTPLDFTGQDLEKDSRATMMISLIQGTYCHDKGYDPMDPRCGRVIFSGRVKKIEETDKEYPTAKTAIFTRHPWLSHMPPNHNFYFAKLEIETIAVLAKFGGAEYVPVNEYFNANENTLEEYSRKYR